MTIASVSSAGVQANADSLAPAMSANGRYVAFESVATNLVSADTNEKSDIFLRDVMSNTTTLVSIGRNGEPANGDSYGASISDDGRCVTFASKATNLVDDDTNGATMDVFVRWLGYSGEAKIQIINGHRNMLPLVLRM
jgi:Tol biopolymer transport system component